MLSRTLFFAGLFLLASTSLLAQGTERVGYHSAHSLSELVSGAAASPAGFAGKLLGNHGSYTYILLRRDSTSDVESHAEWDDLMFIQSGSAVVVYGGTVTGGRETAPGETRGGSIAGGSRQTVRAGDVLLMPAGVPHQVVVENGGSVTYIIVKVQPAVPR